MIKTARAESLIPDVEETCKNLRRYELKLNPNKCVFGVKVGWFLGYVVIEREIEANPEKIQALQSMTPHNL